MTLLEFVGFIAATMVLVLLQATRPRVGGVVVLVLLLCAACHEAERGAALNATLACLYGVLIGGLPFYLTHAYPWPPRRKEPKRGD